MPGSGMLRSLIPPDSLIPPARISHSQVTKGQGGRQSELGELTYHEDVHDAPGYAEDGAANHKWVRQTRLKNRRQGSHPTLS